MSATEYHTYEFALNPEIQAWPWTFREMWSSDEYEEAWRLLNARGYEMHEVLRYRSEVLVGWPQPRPSGGCAEDDHRKRCPDNVGDLLAWLRTGGPGPQSNNLAPREDA